ncbi:MAG: 2-hydroxychromene-2-carboxylate isomerase [Alphaproteobacteria bacterium]|nr:2-hydroxychromene-2-carboxylate isomerase [Alphaproteobacteria bacterium]
MLTFWYEFASSYSYPAAMRIEAAAKAAGVGLRWRPFLLGPIFAAQGWQDSPFNLYPLKGQYMWRDLARICAKEGLPLRRPSLFPQNGLLAARVAFAGQNEPWIGGFTRAIYSANFAEGEDISKPETVLRCLEVAGGEGEAWLASAADPAVKAAFKAQNDEAAELGLFGAPSFTVDGELFWGNDRLEQAIAWAKGERPVGALALSLS